MKKDTTNKVTGRRSTKIFNKNFISHHNDMNKWKEYLYDTSPVEETSK